MGSNARQSLVANLLLSLAVTVALVALLEGGARLLEARAPRREAVAEYIWDWQARWDGEFYTLRSEAVGWPPWEEVNGDGLRDRSHAEQKPEGVARLVALGDSVTLGDGIRAREAFPQVLQERLDARGPGVEVFNLALWGWSTRQERLAYERIARRYHPDHVLLGVCLNDIPELQNNLSRPPAWLTWLHERSALVRRVVNASGREIRSVEQLFVEPVAPQVERGFTRFFEELRALRSEVEADGARLALVVFPFRFQLAPAAPPPLVQQRLARFCADEGIECLDLLPSLAALGEAAFHDYDHLSVAGARAVAEVLADSPLVPQPLPARRVLDEALVTDAAARAGVAAWLAGGPAPSVPALARLLQAASPDVRRAAGWALARLGPEAGAARGALERALGDPLEAVRLEAARALGALGAEAVAARPALFAALDDPRQGVRWEAARALARIGTRAPDDVEPLVRRLKDEDAFVRAFASWSLGNLGAAALPALPELVAALEQPEAYGPAGAGTAFAKMGREAAAAIPAVLATGLASGDPERRWRAARVLGRIGVDAHGAVGALAEALGDPDERVRAQAARALGRIGPAAGAAADALTRAARDPVEEVREQAVEALRRVSGG